MLLAIAGAVEASDLSIHADIVRLQDLRGEMLAVVRAEARLLFTRADLLHPQFPE